jgi:hypothetical protein
MPTDNHSKSKKAYLVSLKHKLKKHLQQQIKSLYPVDHRCGSLSIMLIATVSLLGCSPSNEAYLCTDAKNPFTNEPTPFIDLELVIDYQKLTVARCNLHNQGKTPVCRPMKEPNFTGHLIFFNGTDATYNYVFNSETRKLSNVKANTQYQCSIYDI